jgi:iron(III) transport system ATP-binding protein
MIEVKELSLTYQSSGRQTHLAVDKVSFTVQRGQVYTLLGPSGCGKTTTLRCVAGLEKPDSGEIVIDGVPVSSPGKGLYVPPSQRAIGMVFQSYAIWPHMSVFENVAFPLRYGTSRSSSKDIQTRVTKALSLVQLDHLKDRPAPHLSGGQQQRLALARAFVMEPKVLLLDEPLSNLDAKLREEMRVELRELIKSIGMTAIFVTHEQIEALTLSDVIAVMSNGKIVQEGSPLDIYQRPTNPFVANFIGQSNLLNGTVAEKTSGGGQQIRVATPVGSLTCLATQDVAAGGKVVVSIRPEHVETDKTEDNHGNALQGTLTAASFIGNAMDCAISVDGQILKILLHPERTPAVGSPITVYVANRHCLAMRA